MLRNTLILSAAASAMVLAAPASADVMVDSDGPIVRLSVTETVEGEPDTVTISAGVTTEARTAVEAMQQNANQMTRVIDQIKALGIADEDIQTTGINLSARYDYNQGTQRQVFRGYTVSNRVSVELDDVQRTGPVLDALVAAGATDLGGPDFSVEDDSAAKAQARETAMQRALEMARGYARTAGYGNVRLLEVSENMQSSGPQPLMRRAATMDVAEQASTPVQPGLVGSSVTLNVTYEMTR
ncbi:SIMPL domain-containing protein [Qipengyuania sp. JC766]|uniref:SIMPL domain-containing protein n=1 Tax=Qipengyuania sp. JC766 TaxID=3232139 RepID=UPI00345AFA92